MPTGIVTDGFGAAVWWLLNVLGRDGRVIGVSAPVNGVFEAKTQKSLRREAQQSVRFQMVTEFTVCDAPKSTSHQAKMSESVAVTEPGEKLPSVLPSMAAPGTGAPGSVLLW